MNQYVYHYFYGNDKEMVLNLFNLNDISSFEQINIKEYKIQWRCDNNKYVITYYFYFAVNRYDMTHRLVQDMRDCHKDVENFDVDGTFTFYTYRKSDLSDTSFNSVEQKAIKEDTNYYRNTFILIMNRCITDTFPKNECFKSVPDWKTVTSKDGRRKFKIRRVE